MRLLILAPLALLVACGRSSGEASPVEIPSTIENTLSFANATWSEPVPVDGPINTDRIEGSPFLSNDGLSLYFDSERTDLGGPGDRDIYVSHRDCHGCPWQTPVRLGPSINTPYVDFGARLSRDGRLLFFTSHKTRPDCPEGQTPPPPDPTRPCDSDMYVSQRTDKRDDLGWNPPVSLGSDLNDPDQGENLEAFQEADGAEDDLVGVAFGDDEDTDGSAVLYFSRTSTQGVPSSVDLYSAPIRVARTAFGSPTVETFGPGATVYLSELNFAGALDAGFAMRADGREVYFYSGAQRPGGVGAFDLWVSTRQSVDAPWGAPVNPGTPLNSCRLDLAPFLSHDGRTLLFSSQRMLPGCPPVGVTRADWDIYVSTRTPSGR